MNRGLKERIHLVVGFRVSGVVLRSGRRGRGGVDDSVFV